MKEVKVMLTCSNIHVKDIIKCLKDGTSGYDIKVYVTNSLEWELPPENEVDGRFVVPRIDDPTHVEYMIKLCEDNKIDFILPISSIDLEILSKHKQDFANIGTIVSVLDLDVMKVANDKIEMYKRFGKIMPKSQVATDAISVKEFAKNVSNKICCKLSNLCGGKGFAVVDEDKCYDITLFHKFGCKHYITLDQLCKVVERRDHEVILQEFVDGYDYTISLLAEHGKVKQIVGYVGYLLDFGSIMYGEIKECKQAFDIAEMIVKDLKLDGNIGIDFIVSKDFSSAVLLEVNPRINASLPFVAAAGCNMIAMRIKQLLGEDVSEKSNVLNGYKMKKYFGTRYFI